MEHNTDKRIREKVNTAERSPASFDSALLWQKINAEVQPKHYSVKPYYYAAASVAVIITVASYVYHISWNQNMNHKLTMLEQAVGHHHDANMIAKNSSAVNTCLESIMLATCPEEYKLKRPEKKRPVAIQIPQPALTHMTGVPFVSEPVVLQQDIKQAVAIAPVDVQNSIPVEPVIGIIIPEKQPVTMVKEKKMKIRLFRSPEKETDLKNDNTTIIFARIK